MKFATPIIEFILLSIFIVLTARLVIVANEKPKVAIVIDRFWQ